MKKQTNKKNKKGLKIGLGICIPLLVLGGAGGAVAGIMLNKDNKVDPIILLNKVDNVKGRIAEYNFKFNNKIKLAKDHVDVALTNIVGENVELVKDEGSGVVNEGNFTVKVQLVNEYNPNEVYKSKFDLTFAWIDAKDNHSVFTMKGFQPTFECKPNLLELFTTTGSEFYPQEGVAGNIANNLDVRYNNESLTPEQKCSADVEWDITDSNIFSIDGSVITWTDKIADKKVTITVKYKNLVATADVGFVCCSPKITGGSTTLKAESGTDGSGWRLQGLPLGEYDKPNYIIQMSDGSTTPSWLTCPEDGVLNWQAITPDAYGKDYKFRIKENITNLTSGLIYSDVTDEITLSIEYASIQCNVYSINATWDTALCTDIPISMTIGNDVQETGVEWTIPEWQPYYRGWTKPSVQNGKLHIQYDFGSSSPTSIKVVATKGIYKAEWQINVGGSSSYFFDSHTSTLDWKDGQDSQAWILISNTLTPLDPSKVDYSLQFAKGANTGASIDKNGIVHWTKDTVDCEFRVIGTYEGYSYRSSQQTIVKQTPAITGTWTQGPQFTISEGQSGFDDVATNGFGLTIGGTPITTGVEFTLKDAPSWLSINNNGCLEWKNAGAAGDYTFKVVAKYGLYEVETDVITIQTVVNPAIITGSRTVYGQAYLNSHGGACYYSYGFEADGVDHKNDAEWHCYYQKPGGGEEEIGETHALFGFQKGVLSWDKDQSIANGVYEFRITAEYGTFSTEDHIWLVIVSTSMTYDGELPEDPEGIYFVKRVDVPVGTKWIDDGKWSMLLMGKDDTQYKEVSIDEFWPETSIFADDSNPDTLSYVSMENGRINFSQTATLGRHVFSGSFVHKGEDNFEYNTELFSIGENPVRYELNVWSANEVGVRYTDSQGVRISTRSIDDSQEDNSQDNGGLKSATVGKPFEITVKIDDYYLTEEYQYVLDTRNSYLKIDNNDDIVWTDWIDDSKKDEGIYVITIPANVVIPKANISFRMCANPPQN